MKRMEKDLINIPSITIEWSEWVSWNDLLINSRGVAGIRVPNHFSGVYEVKYRDGEERLTIGKASNLRMRIKQGLIKGKAKHSSGFRIRGNEDTTKLIIRWAITDRPAAVEEELHKRYKEKFGGLPKYTQHT